MAREDAALVYHEETKHSELSMRTSAHYLDWENRPSPFKLYRDLPSIALPRDFPRPREASLRAIKEGPAKKPGDRRIDLGVLSEILFFSAGLTRKVTTGSQQQYYMRAAPATGALYPIELYVICGDITGLGAGVYHFNPLDFALVKLREGDYRPGLGGATNEESAIAPVTVVFTSLAWRNAWKYEARSYRHWFWDSGVIAANLLATCSAEGLVTKIALGFVDSEVDRLLDLEKGKEATVALALIGVGPHPEAENTNAREILRLLRFLVSKEKEIEYPIIWKANEASALRGLPEVKAWRQSFQAPGSVDLPSYRATFPLRPLNDDEEGSSPLPSLDDVILRRGSTRRFAPDSPVSFGHLSTVINASTLTIPLDFLPREATLIDFYLIANNVEGLPSGSYFLEREKGSLEQLRAGNFRNMSAYLCLEQPLFGDASVVFYLMTDLQHVLGSFGNRGYRAAQFEAGIRAGKIYLSSYSLGMGASGSTFYDDAVTEFFSPHARNKSTMIAVGIGAPAYVARPGRILPQMI